MALARVLISGANGVLARSLAARVRGGGGSCFGVSRRSADVAGFERVFGFGEAPWREGQWRAALREARPSAVFHLAGRKSGAEAQILAANVDCADALFAAMRDLSIATPIVLAGSAAEYGAALRDGAPTLESASCAPASAYGRAKLRQTEAGLVFAQTTGHRVISARIFNAIGPGMPDYLALGDFAAQIAAAPVEDGALVSGDLDVAHDFIGYDAVAATLVALAEHPHACGIYNVCSGQATPLRVYVEAMIAASGKAMTIRTDPARLRADEPRAVFGDTARLRALPIAPPPPAPVSLAEAIYREAERLLEGPANGHSATR